MRWDEKEQWKPKKSSETRRNEKKPAEKRQEEMKDKKIKLGQEENEIRWAKIKGLAVKLKEKKQ